MRFAVIKDGLVVNVIVAPKDWKVEGHTLINSAVAGHGDSYKNRKFIKPEPVAPKPTLRDKYEAATTDAERQTIIAKQLGLTE